MTGLICERLRRAALGDVWSGPQMPPNIDEKDAEPIERAWRVQPPKDKKMLRWRYVFDWRPAFICQRLGIKQHPDTVFLIQLAHAEDEIENPCKQEISGAQYFHNLIPAQPCEVVLGGSLCRLKRSPASY